MFASTTCPTSNSQLSTCSSISNSSSATSPRNTMTHVKCESFGSVSPCDNNSSNQQKPLDEALGEAGSSAGNNNNRTASSSDETGAHDKLSNLPLGAMLPTSNNSNSSATMNASSPINGSDLSNSSVNLPSDTNKTSAPNSCNPGFKEEEFPKLSATGLNNNSTGASGSGGNSAGSSSSSGNSGSSSKGAPSNNSNGNNSNMLSAINTALVKEEPDVLQALANVKKEENILSPNMSPVGFGVIGNAVPSNNSMNRSLSPVKREIDSNSTSQGSSSGGAAGDKKPPSIGFGLGPSDDGSSAGNSLSPPESSSSTGGPGGPGGIGMGVGGGGGPSMGGCNNNPPNNMFNMSNGCIDFMQQQNHIFVFSTNLANKGAEAVLSGHFPTIIAYHCTQPSTKNFLEDFFAKNQMKLGKMQRQNSMNVMCNNSLNGTPPWMNNKVQQKMMGGVGVGGGKLNFPNNPSNNDMMCCDPSKANLEASAEAQKILEGIEAAAASGLTPSLQQKQQPNGSQDCNSIISLQGVKVPDENLTPQQRQHREEQLAKLKKMNQFLFPENDASSFLGGGPVDAKGLKPPNDLAAAVGAAGLPDAALGSLLGNPGDAMGPGFGPGGGDCQKGLMHSPDMGLEWPKLQNDFFDAATGPGGAKNKPPNPVDTAGMSGAPTVGGGVGLNMHPQQKLNSGRSSQGPPPPYHPTQRSASVPIATQSPNPSSPNNPTSNLSLPSPRTSGTLSIPSNSPNMDVHNASNSVAATATSNATTAVVSNMLSTNTNPCFPEGSPPSAQNQRQNARNMNPYNSNPSTPLSHNSPKDVDSFTAAAAAGLMPGDLKNSRSPSRPRSPGNKMVAGVGGMPDNANLEARFMSGSPNLNFPPHIQNSPNGRNQQGPPGGPHFAGRRPDNIPLNPNNNRPMPNKINHAFDPISSLAQMSQQLTSSVPLNSSLGGNNMGAGGGGGMGPGVMGSNDMNMNHNMDSFMNPMEGNMDHCNPGNAGGNMGFSPHMQGPGGPMGGPPFNPNNPCHVNPLMGPMGQRLMNPKMCGPGGFNAPGGPGGMREQSMGYHGVGGIPSHPRMMGRMVNFGNFNISPNIQVKASTPNTIQYMPRYGNPLMGMNDADKMNNSPGGGGMQGMQFFPNQGGDQDDGPGNMMGMHDMNPMGSSSMVRGMRPMRQHPMGPGNPGAGISPRMPGGPPGGPQFPGPHGDGSDLDPSMFNSMPGGGPAGMQMYPGPQKQPGKVPSQNMNSPNAADGGGGGGGVLGVGGGGGGPNSDHHSNLQASLNANSLMAPNNLMPSNNPSMSPMGSNPHYKHFGGPGGMGGGGGPGGGPMSGGPGGGPGGGVGGPGGGPSDLKYAQQYHSFQQQLYATSTRSQQGNNHMGNNANPQFFASK